jgi:hypothetical protein
MVTRISDIICSITDQLSFSDIQKSFYLMILRELIKYRDLFLHQNQILILSKLTSKEFKNLLMDFTNKEFQAVLISSANIMQMGAYLTNIAGKNVVLLPHELCYICAFLNLCSSCSESYNVFAENICQSIIHLRYPSR